MWPIGCERERDMKYYIYSGYTGDGVIVDIDTIEEAEKQAQEIAVYEAEAFVQDQEIEIMIFKLVQTLKAQTTMTFNVIKEKN